MVVAVPVTVATYDVYVPVAVVSVEVVPVTVVYAVLMSIDEVRRTLTVSVTVNVVPTTSAGVIEAVMPLVV